MTPAVACSKISLNLSWLPVHPGMKITDSSQFIQKISTLKMPAKQMYQEMTFA